MPVPTSINDLSQTAGSNSPAGSESPSLIDDYLRVFAAFIAYLRDDKASTSGSYADPTWIASLSGAKLIAGSVQAAALAAGSVTTAKFDANAKAPFAGAADTASTATTVADGGVSTTAKLANGIVTPAKLAQPFTQGTAVASTSGTAIDFTGIPSWAKRITIVFFGVSTNGASPIQIQIGSGSIDASGYVGNNSAIAPASVATTSLSSGIPVNTVSTAAATYHGMVTLTTMGSNIWAANGVVGRSDASYNYVASGTKSLSGALDRIRVTTVNGIDTFDAGSINILYD